jgi:hypothetical protein
MNGLEIFVAGSLWFWLLLAAEAVLLFVLVELDQGALATATLVATLMLLQFLGDINLYGYAIGLPWTVVLGAAGYFTVGTLWAIAKWWFYVHQQRGWYDELRSAYLGLYRVGSRDAMPEDLQHQWQECLAKARRGRRPVEVRPLAARHRAEIARWMSYWPWSLSWTLVKDPIRKAFLTIYREIAAHLQRISDRAFEGVEADLPPAAELPITQRTDPVLAEFGIDVGSLRVESAAGRHATASTLADPSIDSIVGGEKSRPDRAVQNNGVRRAAAQGTDAGTSRL